MVVAIILPDHDECCVKSFILSLKQNSWVTSLSKVSFPNISNGITGGCCILTCIHTSRASTLNPSTSQSYPKPPLDQLVHQFRSHSTNPNIPFHLGRMRKTFAVKTYATVPAALPHRLHSHRALTYLTAFILHMATSPASLVQQSYCCMDFAHHLTHTQTSTYSSTSLELNSTSRIIPTYREYLNLSLPVALGLLLISHIVSQNQPIKSVLMRPSPRKPLPGFSTKYLIV